MKNKIDLLEKQIASMEKTHESDVKAIKQKLIQTAKQAVVKYKRQIDSQYSKKQPEQATKKAAAS